LIQINLVWSLFSARNFEENWAAMLMLLSGVLSSFGGNQLVVQAL
jgi:hypothetical protein